MRTNMGGRVPNYNTASQHELMRQMGRSRIVAPGNQATGAKPGVTAAGDAGRGGSPAAPYEGAKLPAFLRRSGVVGHPVNATPTRQNDSAAQPAPV
jgi:hypothetical protein